MHQVQQDSLSPEKMQFFIAGLSGLPPEEVRKAKILYLRNAVSEYRATQDNLKVVGPAMGMGQPGCLSIVPFFGGTFRRHRTMMETMMANQLRLARERIVNSIDVWKDDLQGETFDLGDEQITV